MNEKSHNHIFIITIINIIVIISSWSSSQMSRTSSEIIINLDIQLYYPVYTRMFKIYLKLWRQKKKETVPNLPQPHTHTHTGRYRCTRGNSIKKNKKKRFNISVTTRPIINDIYIFMISLLKLNYCIPSR